MEAALEELNALPHAARVKRVVDWGKQGSFRDLLRHMSSPSQPIAVRHLALYSCLGSKDDAMCVRALESPSRSLRGLAADILVRITDDNTMPQVGRQTGV
jgi:hypothetical protein